MPPQPERQPARGEHIRLQTRTVVDEYGPVHESVEPIRPAAWLVALPWHLFLDVLKAAYDLLSDFLAYNGRISAPTPHGTRLQPGRAADPAPDVEYQDLVEQLRVQDDMQANELKELRDELIEGQARFKKLAAKYKQLRLQNVHLQAALKAKDQPTSSEFWATHVALAAAAFSLRWLSQSTGPQSEHRLMASLICWPVVGLYIMWLLKSSSTHLTPRLLVCLSCIVIGYVLHAAVENQMVDDGLHICIKHSGGSGL